MEISFKQAYLHKARWKICIKMLVFFCLKNMLRFIPDLLIQNRKPDGDNAHRDKALPLYSPQGPACSSAHTAPQKKPGMEDQDLKQDYRRERIVVFGKL